MMTESRKEKQNEEQKEKKNWEKQKEIREEREDKKLKVQRARKTEEERSLVHAAFPCLYVVSLSVFLHSKLSIPLFLSLFPTLDPVHLLIREIMSIGK